MQQASQELGVSYKTIQRMVADKKLKSKKEGSVRLVLIEDNGHKTDKQKDTGRTNDQPNAGHKDGQTDTSEVGFLRHMVERQQKTIDQQGERLAELNKLFAMNQNALAELNKTLQLNSGRLDNSVGQQADIDQSNDQPANGQVADSDRTFKVNNMSENVRKDDQSNNRTDDQMSDQPQEKPAEGNIEGEKKEDNQPKPLLEKRAKPFWEWFKSN